MCTCAFTGLFLTHTHTLTTHSTLSFTQPLFSPEAAAVCSSFDTTIQGDLYGSSRFICIHPGLFMSL